MKAIFTTFMTVLLSFVALRNPSVNELGFGQFKRVMVVAPNSTAERLLVVLLVGETQIAAEDFALRLAKSGTAVALVDMRAYAKFASRATNCSDFGDDLAELALSLRHFLQTPDLPAPTLLIPGEAMSGQTLIARELPVGSFAALVHGENAEVASVTAIAKSCESVGRAVPVSAFAQQIAEQPHSLHLTSESILDVTDPSYPKENFFFARSSSGTLDHKLRHVLHDIYRVVGDTNQVQHMSRARVEGLELLEYSPLKISRDELVILFSGDGGWSDFTADLAEHFRDSGRPVIGINLITYFWEHRPPSAIARDIESIFLVYKKKWGIQRLRLVGFSHGADLLPFAVNRLDTSVRERVGQMDLISPSRFVFFEFRMSSWLYSSEEGRAVWPELASAARKIPISCTYGEDENESSLCTSMNAESLHLSAFRMKGGHHLNYASTLVVLQILPPGEI